MRLYFVAAEPGECNLDWFIIAQTPEQAAHLWQEVEEVQDFTSGDSLKFQVFDTKIDMDGPARPYDWHEDVVGVLEGETS